MDLDSWQSRLADHFGELACSRDRNSPGQPTFALEHGLKPEEVADVSVKLHMELRRSGLLRDHFLAWVVYAAEYGYKYSGDEYWQTFERETPFWVEKGSPHFIRDCFKEFARAFNGAVPTGVWAKHFSIICWPISHAILPCDLQRQLARIIYDLRYSLSEEIVGSPKQLGRLISERSHTASTRFQQLSEEPLYIGQISSALLTEDASVAGKLIQSDTLKRISEDLERERISRSWMRGTRESLRRSIRFSSIRGQGHIHAEGEAKESAGERAIESIEPRLLLRPKSSSGWDVFVELPDLSAAAIKSPSLRDLVKTSQCRVLGSSGRPRGRGYLLYGPKTVLLSTWPPPNQPLIEFSKKPEPVDRLLISGCVIGSGPRWLFKVSADGIGYELKGHRVRSGRRYVLLSKEALSVPDNEAMSEIEVSCDGIMAIEIEMPEAIDTDLSVALGDLSIYQAGTLQVWPAGLPPVRWDGEGSAEWLTTDSPCIGYRTDSPVDSIEITFNEETLRVDTPTPGVPAFLKLPNLPPGKHILHVSTEYLADGRSFIDSEELVLSVREPRGWIPGTSTAGAFYVVAEPTNSSLEQLWEGGVSFQLFGSAKQNIHTTISLYSKSTVDPICSKKLPEFRPPLDSSEWQKLFISRFRVDTGVQNAYDQAYSGRVQFRSGELGQFTYDVERTFSPIRWIAHRKDDEVYLRLLDDSGSEEDASAGYFSFSTPDVREPLSLDQLNESFTYACKPGLYFASSSGHSRGIVVPPPVHQLHDLKIDPRLVGRSRSLEQVRFLAEIAEHWSSARVMGSVFSHYFRSMVLKMLTSGVVGLVAGSKWSSVERAIEQGGDTGILEVLRGHRRNEPEIELTRKLSALGENLFEATTSDRIRIYAELAEEHYDLSALQLDDDEKEGSLGVNWLSELAVRLAAGAQATVGWAGQDTDYGVRKLMDAPCLVRGARLMVLVLGRIDTGSDGFQDLYQGWSW